MRLPQRPPPLSEVASVAALERMSTPAVQEAIRDANHQYLPWDQVRRKPAPAGLTVRDLWFLIDVSRRQLRTQLPLLDWNTNAPFSYVTPPSLIQLLHTIDRGGGSQLLVDDALERPDEASRRVMIGSLMDEAITTSMIEGAVTTRVVARDMLRTRRPPASQSERMIVNAYQTMEFLRERIREPLTLDLICEVQQRITEGTLDRESDAGQLRTSDDVRIESTFDNEVIFAPPPASLLPARLEKMIAFANQSHGERDFIHPVIKAAILHFWLAYEHPFADGNGRTARALSYWFMLKSEYWLFRYLVIPREINKARGQYYRAFLYSEYENNDVTHFLMYIARMTRRATDRLRTKLDEIRQEQLLLGRLRTLNSRQVAVIKYVLEHPLSQITFRSHQSSYEISYHTARNDIRDLLKRRYLKVTRSGKPQVFGPHPSLAKRLRRAFEGLPGGSAPDG